MWQAKSVVTRVTKWYDGYKGDINSVLMHRSQKQTYKFFGLAERHFFAWTGLLSLVLFQQL
jgi:hypothetical protein